MSEETHEQFLKYLEASNYPVWLTERWLTGRGFDVMMNAVQRAPTHAEWKQYSDTGDLYVNGRRVEVKARGVDFTCAEDWPYRNGPENEQFFVCSTFSYERSNPKPSMFIYWNKALTHVAMLDAKTQPTWVKKKVKDRRFTANPVVHSTYCCSVNLLTFRRVFSRTQPDRTPVENSPRSHLLRPSDPPGIRRSMEGQV